MKWFKHDTGANMDAKLQEVLLDYGLEGYGLYWYCLELISGKIEKENVQFKLEHDARIIARNTGSSVQKVQDIMNRFVELGLFEQSDGDITCFKLAKRLDQSMTSNPAMRQIINTIKQSHDYSDKGHDSVMIQSSKPVTESAKPMQDKIRLDKNRLDKSIKKTSQPTAEPTLKNKLIEIFEYWRLTMNKNGQAILNKKRSNAIEARLKEGYKVEDIKKAILGCSMTGHNMGQNDNGKLFNDLELICRDGSQIERFASNSEQVKQQFSVATQKTISNIIDVELD